MKSIEKKKEEEEEERENQIFIPWRKYRNISMKYWLRKKSPLVRNILLILRIFNYGILCYMNLLYSKK